MPTKPGSRLDWTDGEPEKVEEPSSLKKETGWESAEKPPFQWFNWLFWIQDKWNDYFEAKTDETAAALSTTNSTVSGLGSSLSGLSGTVSGHTTALTALSAADTAHDTAIAGKLTAPSSPASGNAIVDDGSGGSTSITKAAFLKLAAGFTALGDLVYGGASGTPALLPGSTSTIKKVLTQTGNGTVSAAPVWEDFAGLSGVGSVNDITNGDFELTVNGATPAGWNAYADAAAAAPVDGTGGSPNAAVTFLVSTASPIRGTRSAVFTKDAANRQGTGRSFDFAIAGPDRGLVHQLYMEIDTSTNYVAGDLVAYIWDVTNSVLIPTSTVAIPKLTNGKWLVTFTATQSLSYRLIFHISTTNALLWTAKFDSLLINAEKTGFGNPMIPNTAYPLVIGGVVTPPTLGTNTSVAYWKRDLDDMLIEFSINQSSSGTAGSGTYLFPLPPGYTIDPTKIPASFYDQAGLAKVGLAEFRDASKTYFGTVGVYNATNLEIILGNEITTPSILSSSTFSAASATWKLSFTARIPIAEWANSNPYNIGAGAQPEYAFNNGTWDATDTTNFLNGPQGGTIGGPLTADRTKRVRFSSPIKSDDIFILEFSGDRNQWFPVGSNVAGAAVSDLLFQNTAHYGAYYIPVSGSNTDVDVIFAQYRFANGTTYGAAGGAWVAGTYWRLRKVSAQSPVGFGPASEIESGLVTTNSQNFAGEKTFTSLSGSTSVNIDTPAGAFQSVLRFRRGGSLKWAVYNDSGIDTFMIFSQAKGNNVVQIDQATGAVTLSFIHNLITGNINSGRYTPVLTGVANVASSNAVPLEYSRVGNVVTVSGYLDAATTAAANTATEIGISLPIASNLTASSDLGGTGCRSAPSGTAMAPCIITADPANDRARLQFNSTVTTNNSIGFSFQYEVK